MELMKHVLRSLIASATQTLSAGSGVGGCVVLATLLVSCGTAPPTHDVGGISDSPPRYSLVFIIHGDANYLYHDALGNARRADEDVLARAQAVAERNPNAEVFIFHEIERRHVLFLIPRRDGRAYHYRNGRLMETKAYWRDQGESRFDPEARLHEQFAGGRRAPLRLFLYFGHELPEFDEAGYDASYAKRRVIIDDLADGVRSLAGDSTRFDVLVLATCFGGTPRAIGALAPHARYIIASPDNLHLSYFDLSPLAPLDIGPGEDAVAAFADRFARNAFDRLSAEVQTAVSVVVYDSDGVNAFVESVAGTYRRTLSAASGMPPESVRHCDCADDPAYALPETGKALTVYYRAPRFGRAQDKQGHSGWGCWLVVGPP